MNLKTSQGTCFIAYNTLSYPSRLHVICLNFIGNYSS